MERLFTLLEKGGKILLKTSVSKIIWEEAKKENRTYKNKNGFGFIYIPDYEHQV